jgi:hypothetical protein
MGSTDQRTVQWHLVFGFVCGDHHGVHDEGLAWDCKVGCWLGRECARAMGGRGEKKTPREKMEGALGAMRLLALFIHACEPRIFEHERLFPDLFEADAGAGVGTALNAQDLAESELWVADLAADGQQSTRRAGFGFRD